MRKRNIITVCVVMLAISTSAQNYIVKAGHFFDARSGKMLNNQVISIQQGKIKAVGTNIPVSKTDSVIDLSDSWVLPGLMDCHVHITTNEAYRNLSYEKIFTTESNAFRAIRGVVVAKQLLENGFTTIKEIGNDADYATADIIKAIKYGWIPGPTIFYAGKIIAPYGGQTRGINFDHKNFWNLEYIDADSPEEIVKAVRKNMYFGANTIKMVTGDNGIYNEEDIRAAVNEAKKYGLKVSVHVTNDAVAGNAVINGGAASIEHGFELDNDQLQLMKEKGTFLVGTDFSFDNWYAYGMDSATATMYFDMVVDRLKRAYKIGTKMAFGTDIIVDLPGLNRVQTNLKVLQSWKAAGIPPAYILQTMTILAAELLGIEKQRGSLEAGYAADIIALKKNPLEDIGNVSTVRFVMKDGKIVKRVK